ncbi:hypothetical protein [Pontimicrobium sp. IMCC45349]|uniref:hypothetical protein n=1 Tax=Pontimicrobium sp. IMCC45349 TaxID=3391574 RepID=UPI0039A028B4
MNIIIFVFVNSDLILIPISSPDNSFLSLEGGILMSKKTKSKGKLSKDFSNSKLAESQSCAIWIINSRLLLPSIVLSILFSESVINGWSSINNVFIFFCHILCLNLRENKQL